MECGFCHSKFDDERRCPRILRCSHSLCHYCINQLINNNIKVCPFCKIDFQANSPNDVRRNDSILQHLKPQGPKRRPFDEAETLVAVPPAKRIKVGLSTNHNVICQEVQTQIKMVINKADKLQMLITQENKKITQGILSELHSTLNQNEKIISKLKETRVKLQSRLREINQMLFDIRDRSHEEDEDTTILERIRTSKKTATEEENKVEALNKDARKIQAKTDQISDVLHSNTKQDEIGSSLTPSSINIRGQNIAGYIKIESLMEMSSMIVGLLKEGNIYGILECDDVTRYAKISIMKEGKLRVHRLSEEPPEKSCLALEYTDVLKRASTNSRLTFLQLRSFNSRKLLGTLLIRLNDNCKRSDNFWMMCSGEHGPSYFNTRLLEVSFKGEEVEHITSGDYEGKDGSGGQALVPGTGNERGGTLIQPWLAGTVTGEDCFGGDETGAQFKIYTRSRLKKTLDLSFGMVEDGLSSLSSSINRFPNIKNVCIGDCGIVLEDF